MKAKVLLQTLFIILTTSSFAQTDTLNKLDLHGKKDGKWILYLDHKWKEVKDSTQAVYYHYTWYAHGKDIYSNDRDMYSYSFFKKFTLIPSENNLQKGKPKLLDGEYKWQTKNGWTKSISAYKKGEPIYSQEFYKSGQIHVYFDYAKKWQGQTNTHHMTKYSKSGKSQVYYMRNGEYGWAEYEYIDTDTTTIKH